MRSWAISDPDLELRGGARLGRCRALPRFGASGAWVPLSGTGSAPSALHPLALSSSAPSHSMSVCFLSFGNSRQNATIGF